MLTYFRIQIADMDILIKKKKHNCSNGNLDYIFCPESLSVSDRFSLDADRPTFITTPSPHPLGPSPHSLFHLHSIDFS